MPISNHEEADTKLIFHAGLSNEKKQLSIVAKDTDLFLLLIFALGHLESFLSPRHMKIDCNQFINITIIYDNLGSEISDNIPKLHATIGCETTSYKFNIENLYVFEKVFKDPSNLNNINVTSSRSFTC